MSTPSPSSRHLAVVPTTTEQTPSAASDEALMARAALDCRASFSQLLARHEQAIRGFCRGMLGSADQGDDAAQEVFLRLWKARQRYRSNQQFRGYLFTIARNRCLSLLRRRTVASIVGFAPSMDEHPSAMATDVELASQERERLLARALSRIPEKQRSAVVLRFVAQLGYDEIAQAVERPAATVRSRVRLGLLALARHLPEEVCPWND